MEQAPNALTKGSVVKALVTFTLPFLLANVLQSLYGAVDLFVLLHFAFLFLLWYNKKILRNHFIVKNPTNTRRKGDRL